MREAVIHGGHSGGIKIKIIARRYFFSKLDSIRSIEDSVF